MAEGKCTKIFAGILFLFVLLNIANATTFTVGDSDGWGFTVGSWPNGKSFKAGDILVFKYPVGFHNVVVVDKNGYDTCNTSGGKVFSSGNDQITLVKGTNYFICGIGRHCINGLKIAVTAA